jgi:hypothetical protein
MPENFPPVYLKGAIVQEIGEKILQLHTKGVGFWLGVKSTTVKGREEFEYSPVAHEISSYVYFAYKTLM